MIFENLKKKKKHYQKDLEALVRYFDVYKIDKTLQTKFLS